MAAAVVVPEEIIIYEILLRLPVKSLVRYRCVCKSWNSLLYNPDYLSHLNCSISQNPKRDHHDDDDDYLVLMNFNDYTPSPNYGLSIFSRKKLSETPIDNYVPPLLSLSTLVDIINLVGSVNGLVCMSFDLFEGGHQLILWNPTICFSETILVPKELDDCDFFMYGFGWDSVTNDYKLIILACADDDEDFSSFFVYSYNTNHWSNIEVVTPDHWCNCLDYCFIVNGSPYWCKWAELNILKFDTRNHKCTTLKIPSDCYYYRLINLNDCLALVDYHKGSTPRVFCFDEEHNIWMHMYTLTKRLDHWDFKVYGFNYGGGEIVFYGNKNLYLCDPKSHKIKRHPRRYPICGGCTVKSHTSYCRGGFSYTPSLVVLQGMKALHL